MAARALLVLLLLLAPAPASALAALQVATRPWAAEAQRACPGRGDDVAAREDFLRRCPTCRLSGIDAPRLYITEPKDGLGSRLHDVIAGMAIAAKTGTVLAGVSYGKATCSESHGIDIMNTAGEFFGLENPRSMFTSQTTQFNQAWPGLNAFLGGISRFGIPKGNQSIFLVNHCLSCEIDTVRGSISSYYNPRFLRHLREASFIWRRPVAYKSGTKFVAIHVRRGDVDATDKLRGTSDVWYFSLIEQLRTLVPDADIHVFSSLETQKRSSDFDGYRTRGCTVHLDGDPMDAWANFASADVLVMAKSSFSHVPALINKHCVVYQPYWHRPLDEWVSAQADDAAPLGVAATRALNDCIVKKAYNGSSASHMPVSVTNPKPIRRKT